MKIFRKKKINFLTNFHFNPLFDQFPDTIEVFDRSGNRLYTNRNLKYYSDTRDTAKDFSIFTDEIIRNSEFYGYLLKVCEGETIIIKSKEFYKDLFDWYLPHAFYEITIFPIQNDENEVISIAIIHREILPVKLSQEYNEQELRTLENKISHSILTNISHELRTPLNWILGFSELIRDEKNIVKIKEFNKTIKRGGDLLLSQVEKLIEMSSIVKNTDVLEKTKFQINQVLFELYGLVKNELDSLEKDISLKLNCGLNDEKSIITSDKTKLSQILLNLLYNSIKFTKKGQIEMGVFMTHEKEYLFYVKDTGIGMDKLKQKYIFDVFKKGEGENFNAHHGQGLGLSISSHYVKNLGGEIWVDSEIGIGSTFYFTVKDFSDEVKTEEVFNIH